jgi:beta-glucosidase
MVRPRSGHTLGWDTLESRLCPAIAGAAALVPAIERTDSYAVTRHVQNLLQVANGNDGVVFVGDSIADLFANGAGASVWSSEVAPLGAADFGVISDVAENVLWRLENGELAGTPRLAIVEVGTNDLTNGYSVNYTVAAIQAVVEEIQTISPGTQILLMGLFPRGASASDPLRQEVASTNAELAGWAASAGVGFLDIGPALTASDGSISADYLPGLVHPNAQGYSVWAAAIEGLLVNSFMTGQTSWTGAGTTRAAVTSTAGARSLTASAGGLAGVSFDGYIWHYDANGLVDASRGQSPWQRVGSLDSFVAVVTSTNHLGQSELFAERADGSVWVYDYASSLWSNTGGYLVNGSMIADGNGIIGLGVGGIVFQYAEGYGWSRVGTLGDAASLVLSSNLIGQTELFAQTADGSVWDYHWSTGTWADTGGGLAAGTMVADSNGISGVAGGGTVFHYFDEGGWVQVGPLSGSVALVLSWGPTGHEELFAQLSDLSVWAFDFAVGIWKSTGGKINAGSLGAISTGVVGIAGGTVFRYVDGSGWLPMQSAQSFVSVIDGRDASGNEVLFARTSDGTLYQFSLALPSGWVDEYGRFI